MNIIYNIIYYIGNFISWSFKFIYWLFITNMQERPFTMLGISVLCLLIIGGISYYVNISKKDPHGDITEICGAIAIIFITGVFCNTGSAIVDISRGYSDFKVKKEYELMQEHVKELTNETNVKTETIPVETSLETKLYNYTEQHPEFATLTKEIIDSLYKDRYVHDSTQAMLRDSSQIKAYIIAHIMDGYTDRNVKIEFLGDSLTQKDTYVLSNGLYNMFSNLNKDRINETKPVMVTNE